MLIQRARLATLTITAVMTAAAGAQTASVSVTADSTTVPPGGSVTITLRAEFDTAGASGGLFGDAGFYGFGGEIRATGGSPGDLTAEPPAIDPQLGFGATAMAGSPPLLARGAGGRGFEGGLDSGPVEAMVFELVVAADATPGTVDLIFDGSVVLALGSSLVTYSTSPGANQQPLPITPITITIGQAGCNDADNSEPFGVLDLSDITGFTSGFLAMDPAADLDGNGTFDLSDLSAFVSAFLDGCP